MPFVPDIEEYCGEGTRISEPACFRFFCDKPANSASADCQAYQDFCDAKTGGTDNMDLPECTAPCELEANVDDNRCNPPDDENRRRRLLQLRQLRRRSS
jgi:hypothetical protein